ncbi:MAG: transcription antitermination factor NusB [bacterium]
MLKIGRHQQRVWSLQILYALDLTENLDTDFYKVKISELKKEHDLSNDHYYFEELIQGVLANYPEYDNMINQTAIDWEVSRMAYVDRNILRISIHEMKNEIPVAVVINEAVEIAKEYADQKSAKFINGILAKLSL